MKSKVAPSPSYASFTATSWTWTWPSARTNVPGRFWVLPAVYIERRLSAGAKGAGNALRPGANRVGWVATLRARNVLSTALVRKAAVRCCGVPLRAIASSIYGGTTQKIGFLSHIFLYIFLYIEPPICVSLCSPLQEGGHLPIANVK